MKFGVRQICNVVFKAKTPQKIGNYTFQKMQPVLYIETAKTSTLESQATTVYATGGRGNTRLITWEGEKTLTFTVEQALLSPISFAMLSGAGVIKGSDSTSKIRFHQTTRAYIEKLRLQADSSQANPTDYVLIDLTDALNSGEVISSTSPIFIAAIDDHNDLTGNIIVGQTSHGATVGSTVHTTGEPGTRREIGNGKWLNLNTINETTFKEDTVVIVDYYVEKLAKTVTELQIDAENFGGYYYVEADSLFRRESDGKDLPVNITLPKVKIQSNFTFSMASSGDPSTFTFTMDAMPDYTYFDKTKKVLCAMQIVDDVDDTTKDAKTVFSASTPSEAVDDYDSRGVAVVGAG